MSTSDERRNRIIQTWEQAWTKGNIDALDTLLSPGYLRHGHDGSIQGLAEFKATVLGTRSAFPDLSTEIEDILIDGNRAAIRWRSSGRHTNSLLGIPPTNQSVTVSGATFSRFVDDVIIEEHVTWDPRALLSALGIISLGQD